MEHSTTGKMNDLLLHISTYPISNNIVLSKKSKGPKNTHRDVPFTYISKKAELENIEFLSTHVAKYN